MDKPTASTIYEKVRLLPSSEQQEVLEMVESKIALHQADKRPFWERMAEISSEIPEEEWAKLPSDGSVNHDHYLYGAPKKY